MNVAKNGTPIESHPLTCLRKRRYENEAEAWRVIWKMRARNQDTNRLQPYPCQYCKGHHLGRLPPGLVSHPPLVGI